MEETTIDSVPGNLMFRCSKQGLIYSFFIQPLAVLGSPEQYDSALLANFCLICMGSNTLDCFSVPEKCNISL